MEIIGIIAEYNPFHNGHIYQIEKIKEKYPDSILISVISTTFTQRGLPSIINKWDKSLIALNHGIDIVLELPFNYATQSADIFASGSIDILNKVGINKLIFGSESNDIETLKKLASIQLNDNSYDLKVKEYLHAGLNYPTSMSRALSDISGINISEPNDILALSYIKVIRKNNYKIEVEAIKRTNSYLSKKLDSNIASATSIRQAIEENIDIKNYVPTDTYEALKKEAIFLDKYFDILKYKIITAKDLSIYLDVDEGIEGRLIKCIQIAKNMDEFIELVHTKRYTYNKVRRMIVHILCCFTKEDKLNYEKIEFIRVLGFSNRGKAYLNGIKKKVSAPIITNFVANNKYLELEMKISKIYALASNNYENIIRRELLGPVIKK